MLTSVDNHLSFVVAQGHLPRGSGRFDELGASADDGEKLHITLFRFRIDLSR